MMGQSGKKRLWAGLLILALVLLPGCAGGGHETGWADMTPTSRMPLSYAEQFTVDCYAQGYRLITIGADARYLVVPEGQAVPENLPQDMVVVRQPLSTVYLAATSAMDPVCTLGALPVVRLTGTDSSGWYLPQVRQALETGELQYAGKYSAPDYELLLSAGCDLAVESTMIYHTPQVKEKLEMLDIPVLVERSSYESDPLGRMEWVKLYGVLLGKESEATQLFEEKVAALQPVLDQPATGKTVVFFHINSTGTATVRKPGDYVARMIAMAGGGYLPQGAAESENALSTMNMDMESFYAAAKDADVIIYNSTIDGELQTLEQLLQKSSLLADFKAVQTGNVWCTGKNMFQESMSLGEMILDLHAVLTQQNPAQLRYLHRLQ